MKPGIARGLFIVWALGVASTAVAVWHEPGSGVVQGFGEGTKQCPIPPNARAKMAQVEPGEGLLLLLFALSQGRGYED